jgi:hypothetical protein
MVKCYARGKESAPGKDPQCRFPATDAKERLVSKFAQISVAVLARDVDERRKNNGTPGGRNLELPL